MAKDASNDFTMEYQANESSPLDDVVIQDQPSLYPTSDLRGDDNSIHEPVSSNSYCFQTAPEYADGFAEGREQSKPDGVIVPQHPHGSLLRANRSMIDKLKKEINHLETWLSTQSSARRRSPLSVANTIRSLIATRKSLLDSLEKRLR